MQEGRGFFCFFCMIDTKQAQKKRTEVRLLFNMFSCQTLAGGGSIISSDTKTPVLRASVWYFPVPIVYTSQRNTRGG